MSESDLLEQVRGLRSILINNQNEWNNKAISWEHYKHKELANYNALHQIYLTILVKYGLNDKTYEQAYQEICS